MTLRRVLTVALVGLGAAASACAFPGRLLRGYAEGRPPELDRLLASDAMEGDPIYLGMVRFTFDDMGSLNTDGLENYTLPWKVVAAGMVLRAHDLSGVPIDRSTLDRILQSHGFITPTRIENWIGRQPVISGPIGLLRANLSRGFPRVALEAASVGCAGCHAGVLYDDSGRPTNTLWLGAPNTSINLEQYVLDVFGGLAHFQGQEDRLWETLDRLFPDMTDAERSTIGKHALPAIRDRFADDWIGRESAVPFTNGSAGLTNGVGSVKNMLGLLGEDERGTEVAFTSIPHVGARTLRSSLLYDGTYGVPGSPRFLELRPSDVSPRHLDRLADIVTFFVVPTLGIRADRARTAYPKVRQVMDYLGTLTSPPFPAPIDTALALEGEAIYRDRCASCHGEFSPGLENVRLVSFPNRLVPQDEMGTDPNRWQLATPRLADAVARSGYGRYITVETTGGYVATPLTAVWISAPYLHNGSVPTLWHLMHPDERPERFMVGGHRLDLEHVGIAGEMDETGLYDYPAVDVPWSTPALYDTREPGKSRQGHEAEFDALSEAQKRALIEYMKAL
ncbi:MAG TPA: hypothetical protein VMM79_13845 [Longimicrobiales bacterium]|nr:hypothetical protein [Longimicrobiales bacterium]